MWLHKEFLISILFRSWSYSWDSFPVFIKVCFIISMLALFGIVIAMVDIAMQRFSRKRLEKKTALLSVRINELLTSAVIMEEPAMQKKISFVKSDFNIDSFYDSGIPDKEVNKILVTEMIRYRNYFSGQIAERIRKLYLDLSLHKEAINRLHKKNWETKAAALSELFKMDIEVDHTDLLPLLDDKNRYIREFTRLSLIKFTKADPLQFLRDISEPISQWEEFEIFQLFQQKKDFTLSSLEGLIALDKEPSIVSLCLKLAVHFKQEAALSLIVNLIKTPNLKLRGEAIACLGMLEAKDTERKLVAIYPMQPHVIKLEILTALGRMQSRQCLDFLEKEFISSSDFEIKKYASDAIIKLYPLSKSTIDKLMLNAGILNQKILNHSLDPLINAS